MEVNRYHIKSPLTITTTQLGIPLDYKKECIEELYRIGDQQNKKTNVKAIMTSYLIWEETDVLNLLISNILETINLSNPPEDCRAKYHLRDCWGAIYKKHHYTKSHNHVNATISFVYYLKTSPQSSPLIFDGCEFKIQPQEDMLVVFPCYVNHSVPIHTDNEDRICIAGNIDIVAK